MDVLDWLMEGDPALRWQVMREFGVAPAAEQDAERALIASVGAGAQLLALQGPDGRWGGGLYSPKWTSTFYTMQLLQIFGLPAGTAQAVRAAELLATEGLRDDGGLNYGPDRLKPSETCISGMGLATLSTFLPADPRLAIVADYLLAEQMDDGGWNCRRGRGATHASMHTTISALEGLLAFESATGHSSRVTVARERGHEFLLQHRLFRSHRDGTVINEAFTRLSFPAWWHFDVLRALEYFVDADAPKDERMQEAVEIVRGARRVDGRWPIAHKYSGRTFFPIEPPREASRWNTFRAMKVLRWWDGTRG